MYLLITKDSVSGTSPISSIMNMPLPWELEEGLTIQTLEDYLSLEI